MFQSVHVANLSNSKKQNIFCHLRCSPLIDLNCVSIQIDALIGVKHHQGQIILIFHYPLLYVTSKKKMWGVSYLIYKIC